MNRMVQEVGEAIRNSVALRRLLVVCWHSLGAYVTYVLAFQIRFDGQVPVHYAALMWQTLPLLIVVCLLMFVLFRLYSGMWAYFSVDDLARMGLALAAATALFAVIVFSFRGLIPAGFPRSIIALEFLLMGAWMTAGRFVARYAREHGETAPRAAGGNRERVLVVGKLADADLLLRSARRSDMGAVVGMITDETSAHDHVLHGVRVRGGVDDVARVARDVRANCILILPPFNRPREMDAIVRQCADEGVPAAFRTVPSLADLASGQITASSIRNVDIEDLLGRGQAQLDRTEVRRFIKGKRVLVTGAGGSIGREICLQVAGYEAEAIVLFESCEFNLYEIENDVRRRYPNLTVIACAGDIRHEPDVRRAFDLAGGIDVIYHAAAYKHVPLMEANVPACFRTNVLGTACVAFAAQARGVDRFVMISSDKAVRPTSAMGATKRLAERVINELTAGPTTFVSVRFGNVFESSGSVIPLFKKQIAAGGPVTVTSPNVRRYFMTIPEAVDLVLMAGTAGRNHEIMVLEMGEAIRIVDLARRLIELSGLVPDRDIPIRFVGLRPGEKEYEEVMTADENVVRTSLDKIWVLKKNAGPAGPPPDLQRIERLAAANDADALRALAAEYVPENQFAASGGGMPRPPGQP